MKIKHIKIVDPVGMIVGDPLLWCYLIYLSRSTRTIKTCSLMHKVFYIYAGFREGPHSKGCDVGSPILMYALVAASARLESVPIGHKKTIYR